MWNRHNLGLTYTSKEQLADSSNTMDISHHLTADVYGEHKANPNISVGDLTQQLGWEETQGTQVSPDVATDVKEVVESKMKKLQKDPMFEKISKRIRNEDTHIQVLRHSQIRLGELLGEGGFNQIFTIRSMPEDEESNEVSTVSRESNNNNQNVVKVLRNELADNDVRFALCAADIVKEALFMSALDHKNIVKITAVSEGGIASFEHGCRPDAFFLVMEKLEETLFHRIQKWKLRFRDVRARPSDRGDFFRERLQVATGIVDGLAHMHAMNMIHRDIKPENLGFDGNGVIKVFDFGLARMVPESKDPNETFNLTQKSGTHRYISPENYKGQPYNLKSDVYSYTMLLYHILSLNLPFKTMDSGAHEHMAFDRGNRPIIPLSWPRAIRKLIKRGWSQKISKRPTMQQMRDAIHEAG